MKNKKMLLIVGIVGFCLIAIALFVVLSSLKKESYVISFDSDGGSFIVSQEVVKGEKIIKPSDPTKEGYDFVKWNYNDQEYDFNTDVTSSMILKAIWNMKEVKYTLTFNVGDISKVMEVSKPSDINLDSLEFEEKAGYELVWYVDGKEYDLNSEIKSNMTLEGKYVKTNNLTVKFNSDGGSSVASQSVKPNEKASEPASPTKEGYIFNGWYLNNEKYDFNKEVTTNITLKAKWEEDPNVKRYTVTFDSNGGSKVGSQRVIENKKASQPGNPTKKGYAFVEWQLNGKKYDFSTRVTKNITLKATWRELNKYTVTFMNDDNSTISTSTVTEGDKVSKPSNPTKADYTFKEWQLNGKAYDFNTKVTKNITLKAYYTKTPVRYTVTFSDGVSSQLVDAGAKATRPSNPSKSGFTFVEWQLDGVAYDFNTPVTRSISLKALWRQNVVEDVYTISATSAGFMSVDEYLKVYKNNSQINFNKITCTDGYFVASSDGIAAISDEKRCNNSFIVVLTNGTSVRATLK